MRRKNIVRYFDLRIEGEHVPEFSTVRPLLEKYDSGRSGMPVYRVSLAFYSVFISLAVLIVATGFACRSAFPEKVASYYSRNALEPVLEKRFSDINDYMAELKKYRRGGK